MNPNSITSIIHPKFVCGFCNKQCGKKNNNSKGLIIYYKNESIKSSSHTLDKCLFVM